MVTYYNGLELTGDTPYLFLDFDGVFNALNHELIYVGESPLTELKMIFRDPKDWAIETHEVDNSTHYAPTATEEVEFRGKKLTVQWSDEMITDFNEILNLNKVMPLILSTWRQVGAEVLMPLMGLNVPTTNWLDFSDSTLNAFEAGKFRELDNLYNSLKHAGNPTPPFVWVDDNATHYYHNLNNPEEQEIAHEFGASTSLIVKPDARTGISRYEMIRIREFIEAL